MGACAVSLQRSESGDTFDAVRTIAKKTNPKVVVSGSSAFEC